MKLLRKVKNEVIRLFLTVDLITAGVGFVQLTAKDLFISGEYVYLENV
ncbi:hypothetical protein [Pedobacter sp. L105]|nr:hypothetical protein [Pedobacter sp. L105]